MTSSGRHQRLAFSYAPPLSVARGTDRLY